MAALLPSAAASARPTSHPEPNTKAVKPAAVPTPDAASAKPTDSPKTKTISRGVGLPPKALKRESPVTYTVKRGDTLSGIAQWFSLHGYGSLYAVNAAVIGRDPNLIRPGERITLGNGSMTLQPPS